MNIKGFGRVCAFAMLCGIMLTYPLFVNAQEQQKDTAKDSKSSTQQVQEAMKDPDSRTLRSDNYLNRFRAVESVEWLMKENLERIYLLKVITTNFDNADWRKAYNEIYAQYRDGLHNYYQRKVITSSIILGVDPMAIGNTSSEEILKKYPGNKNNRSAISDLLKDVAMKYRQDTNEMLDTCAKAVLIVSLNKLTRYDPDKNKQLLDNMMRLRVAYGEMDSAYEAAVDHKYMYSIYHYRVAKSYAITIMNDLISDKMARDDIQDPEEKKMYDEIIQKKNSFDLATHIADNQNKVKDKK